MASSRRHGTGTSVRRRRSVPYRLLEPLLESLPPVGSVGPAVCATAVSPVVGPPAPGVSTGGCRVLSAFRSALTTPDLRKKILFTLGMVAVYRLGAAIPSPGVSYPNVQECIRQVEGGENSERLLADQPVLRRCAAAAVDLRAGHHALHHGQHHRPAADGGHPALRAAEEGRPVRSGQADPVHPVPDDRAGDPAVHRHRGAGRPRAAVRQLHPAGHPRLQHLHARRSSSSR